MSRAEIEAAIPHRPPFLLLDEIVLWEPDRIVCLKTFSADEPFFAGHYPDFPITPGVLLCEAAMQAGAVLLSRIVNPAHNGIPVAARMSDVKFRHMVRPGETVEIDVEFSERMADTFFLKAKVNSNGRVAVRLDFAVALAAVPAKVAG